MQRTKIEWADYSWNPIKGMCPTGCWYCYARRMYQRFGLDAEIRLDVDELMADFPKKPSRIFVCSTFELFHPLADPYRRNVFRHIRLTPEHTFIILTKMPERIDRLMPDNVWLGTTITQQNEASRKADLMKHEARIRFISYEPMLDGLDPAILNGLDWAILGRLTGHGRRHDPEPELIEAFIDDAKIMGVPLFLKDNLEEICGEDAWGEPLIQEFPIEG